MFDTLKIARLGAVATGAMMLFAVSAANAVPYAEIGDTGGTTVTAQDVGVGVDMITGGYLALEADKDWYKISYGTAVTFSAGPISVSSEFVALNLLDATGTPLATCEDCFFTNGGTLLPVPSLSGISLAAGDYFIEVFPSLGGTAVPVFANFAYSIGITTTTAAPPPTTVAEPGTLAMFGLGLAGLGCIRRRKVA